MGTQEVNLHKDDFDGAGCDEYDNSDGNDGGGDEDENRSRVVMLVVVVVTRM